MTGKYEVPITHNEATSFFYRWYGPATTCPWPKWLGLDDDEPDIYLPDDGTSMEDDTDGA